VERNKTELVLFCLFKNLKKPIAVFAQAQIHLYQYMGIKKANRIFVQAQIYSALYV